MFRNVLVRGVISKAGNKISRPMILCLILVFAVCPGGAGQNTSVLAAPLAQEIVNLQTTYALVYRLPKDPICAGETYNIPVRLEARSTGSLNGDQVNFEELLYGVTVVANSNDHNVVEFDPYIGVTGDEELLGPGGEPTEITLVLFAKKAGSTSISFDAQKPSIFFNAKFPPKPIKVVNCKYKVNISSRWNFRISVAGWTGSTGMAAISSGEMRLNDVETSLQGTGRVDWTMYSISPGCSQHHKIAVSQVHLEGTPGENDSQIVVKVTYDPASLSSTHCVGGESGQFAPPPINVSLPADGGAQTVDHSFVLGEENLTGYSTVKITPIAAQ
jgi:hypothetical protein